MRASSFGVFHSVFRNVVVIVIIFLAAPLNIFAEGADLILINGNILTVDPRDSIAHAIAIGEGKILAVGSNEEVRKHARKDTRIVDLHGRTATPGLIDSHCHFDETGVLFDIDLSNVKNIGEVVELVRKKASQVQPGTWIVGSGWDESKLSELRYVTAADLDKASLNNPVWLWHTTGHYGVANSKAMQLAEIKAETKDPAAGVIDRDTNGQPTGLLKEDPAWNLSYASFLLTQGNSSARE
jgi:predicted amidohydrolase YtcJ